MKMCLLNINIAFACDLETFSIYNTTVEAEVYLASSPGSSLIPSHYLLILITDTSLHMISQ